jgi:hypothetical protein
MKFLPLLFEGICWFMFDCYEVRAANPKARADFHASWLES